MYTDIQSLVQSQVFITDIDSLGFPCNNREINLGMQALTIFNK